MSEKQVDLTKEIDALAKKAETAEPGDALKYSQSASNLAHAMATVNSIQKRPD